ncbi:hypothetical protein [Microtetraspora glauca]|uniref:MarR family transcriptional regulator n=1 Tax=Microtetraspora glauca TaxID=1996 RepID=A0ABV3G7S9_MICGL
MERRLVNAFTPDELVLLRESLEHAVAVLAEGEPADEADPS